jgi:nitroimidazol reductase NimA-like FMN-containing flavoprotein (pyridoxamine 5'-phosphate oxidase superfamily)
MAKNYSLETTPANEQRLSKYAKDDAWIQAFLHQVEIGRVATRWDDQPFVTPTTFWYDETKNEIFFHSNIVGRVRANIERHPRVCFEASRAGRFLPSDVALEFSVQYASVIAFGVARIITDEEEKKRALYGLINRYFPDKRPGEDYRPITDSELARTSVYAISIESWSGKENWPEQAEQSNKTTEKQGATR